MKSVNVLCYWSPPLKRPQYSLRVDRRDVWNISRLQWAIDHGKQTPPIHSTHPTEASLITLTLTVDAIPHCHRSQFYCALSQNLRKTIVWVDGGKRYICNDIYSIVERCSLIIRDCVIMIFYYIAKQAGSLRQISPAYHQGSIWHRIHDMHLHISVWYFLCKILENITVFFLGSNQCPNPLL